MQCWKRKAAQQEVVLRPAGYDAKVWMDAKGVHPAAPASPALGVGDVGVDGGEVGAVGVSFKIPVDDLDGLLLVVWRAGDCVGGWGCVAFFLRGGGSDRDRGYFGKER